MEKQLVLVVDDDADTCELLSLILNGNRYQVEVAHDAYEGIEKLRHLEPDLVLLDVMMPGMDGWEACQRIKAEQNVPVVFVTVKSDFDSIAAGMKLGAHDYIVKPFTIDDIRERVASVLDMQAVVVQDLPLAVIADSPTETQGEQDTPGKLYFALKRAMDIIGSLLALIFLFPIFLIIALMIRLETPGPVIFKQARVAHQPQGKINRLNPPTFTFFKFRTMKVNSDAQIHRSYVTALIHNDVEGLNRLQNGLKESRKLEQDPRITRTGRFLRKTSLDELPQFWNVLLGDMSLVGPRPPIPYEVEMYSDWHLRRLESKPGLTGLWQISARSDADFDAMIRLDLWYVEHPSLLLDIRILLQTPLAVLSMKGAM